MAKRILTFGVIGCGLMGREFASAAARWCHLLEVDFEPRIIAACDAHLAATEWFKNNTPHVRLVTTDYQQLLNDKEIEAVYCAVPHNLHEKMYCDIIRSGKHLLGEKPFGIDQSANQAILQVAQEHPKVLVRCSSEFPFYPGAYQMGKWIRENKFGKIIEVEAGFWHSSDLDPHKKINWKRRIATNGEYGCMGDLGMHVLHIPLRFGWYPSTIRALLSKIVPERPNDKGEMVPCETWDNAILACEVKTGNQEFPMVLSTKRIAPGHGNTWFIRVMGTEFSAEFSTKNPKQLSSLPYTSGQEQAWHVRDVQYHSAYKAITGEIFEFGFSDSILQMWAAFCDEIIHRDSMKQSFHCVTTQETAQSHKILTAALQSHNLNKIVNLEYSDSREFDNYKLN